MTAIANVAKLRDAGMEPWRAAMYADHYIAECVLVGGARRAARMATKTWYDPSVLGFIQVKRGGFLWSSNNSVTVDSVFWESVQRTWPLLNSGEEMGSDGKPTLSGLSDAFGVLSTELHKEEVANIGIQVGENMIAAALDKLFDAGTITELDVHAYKVFDAVCRAAYFDGTGEPGFITVEKLTYNDEGTDILFDGNFAESTRYKLSEETLELTRFLANAWQACKYKVITNPCGEIVLIMLGAYCVIADVVPFFAGSAYRSGVAHAVSGQINTLMDSEDINTLWDADAEDAFRVATRALIRTNTMDSLYSKEVKRTNRIGVGMTGLHEYAWARFGFAWADIVDEERSKPFWLMLSRFKRAVQNEAKAYSAELGVVCPHTDTTMKPAGTTSKLFSLTEGAHLPSMLEYIRWVQFRTGDPLIEQYEAMGYPTRKLQIYAGTTIVGFPTRPTICELGMGDRLVTAAQATPEEQYAYLQLLEKYYIRGVEEDGVTPLRETGNQVSYTLKYDPKVVSFTQFAETLMNGQSKIRCCSVMPQIDGTVYEYQPEEPTSRAHYEAICNAIEAASGGKESEIKEDIGLEHVDCSSGACPVDFRVA